MGLTRKRYRTFKPSELTMEFSRIVVGSYVHKQRDPGYIRKLMENNALDSVDILFAITEYAKTSGARDIPSFCRWANRNVDMFDGDKLAREGLLAETLSHERLPIATLPYYDLLNESIPDARLERHWRSAAGALRTYVASVLGAA